ncbi:MAG: hypothetical protein CMQ39_08100 [Gammaproteobacteria bacterium]|nr:hypothetical protein [Gammaproteobacteria bacterium]|tara:strand:- start:1916 stop:2659 length:744 start_codon:yes stop_codon:yes gene_type:complete
MSVDTNAVHESIKLALDAADAATDVTTEYNRVKRDHKNLEASVKQIHRYTTIIFSVSIGTAILAILLTSLLYFRSLSELSVMTTTSKEALVVFAENVENVNGSLSKLEGALQKQTELLDVNRQLIKSMEGLQTIVTDSNDQMVVELRALTKEMSDSTLEVTNLVKGSSQSQLKSINLEIKKQISGVGSKTSDEISSLKSKIKNTDSDTLRKLSLNQAAILSTLQAVSSQNDDIKKRFEEQQDKISFP